MDNPIFLGRSRDSLGSDTRSNGQRSKAYRHVCGVGDLAFMEEAFAAGVSSYNVRGTSLPPARSSRSYKPPSPFSGRYQKLAGDLQIAETRLDSTPRGPEGQSLSDARARYLRAASL